MSALKNRAKTPYAWLTGLVEKKEQSRFGGKEKTGREKERGNASKKCNKGIKERRRAMDGKRGENPSSIALGAGIKS